MKTKFFVLFASFCFYTAICSNISNQNPVLPSVTLKTMEGKTVNIQDYGKTGKTTILIFWETFCSPSIKGLDNVSDIYEDWQKKYKCDLVAINVDDARNISKVKPLVNGKDWPYIFLTDVNKDLLRALNIPNCPYILILNNQGHIVYSHNGFPEGFEGEIENQIKKLVK